MLLRPCETLEFEAFDPCLKCKKLNIFSFPYFKFVSVRLVLVSVYIHVHMCALYTLRHYDGDLINTATKVVGDV